MNTPVPNPDIFVLPIHPAATPLNIAIIGSVRELESLLPKGAADGRL
jgi:hypothetical protein